MEFKNLMCLFYKHLGLTHEASEKNSEFFWKESFRVQFWTSFVLQRRGVSPKLLIIVEVRIVCQNCLLFYGRCKWRTPNAIFFFFFLPKLLIVVVISSKCNWSKVQSNNNVIDKNLFFFSIKIHTNKKLSISFIYLFKFWIFIRWATM